jgi:hypothetical protein
MARRRGNPDWGKPLPAAPTLPSEFKILVKQLRLTPEKYASSRELKEWCRRNRNRCYVPEWLLKEWQIVAEVGDFG